MCGSRYLSRWCFRQLDKYKVSIIGQFSIFIKSGVGVVEINTTSKDKSDNIVLEPVPGVEVRVVGVDSLTVSVLSLSPLWLITPPQSVQPSQTSQHKYLTVSHRQNGDLSLGQICPDTVLWLARIIILIRQLAYAIKTQLNALKALR